MELRRVNPQQIKVPEVRVTASFDEELRERFSESIKALGQLSPPLVYEVDRELILCDGLHRLEEAKLNGEGEIEVAVLPGDMLDVLTKNLVVDHLRGKTKVSDMVVVFKTLYQDYNLDPDQISEKTGYPRNYIERLLKISEASPEVLEALDQGAIGVGVAFELSRLPLLDQQDEVLAKSTVYRLKTADVKKLVDDTLQYMKEAVPGAPVQPSRVEIAPRIYHCEGCKEEVDPRYLRPVNLCPNCFGEVWRLAKLRVSEEVEINEE